ncbi:MAG: DUF615 domain-containing protein [Xanthomonadales bacterium]|nr:DUF615 domain-containing protein [Xanthomonadales bacterium]
MLKLCRELVALTPRALDALPLEADLLREIEFARSIRSNVARKRQLQFVAKMMRSRDVSPITDALASLNNDARQLTERHHRAETWRDRLIEGGDPEVAGFLQAYPFAEAQALRQLLRNAQRESRLGKPPASARKLFRMLRDLDSEAPLPPPSAD